MKVAFDMDEILAALMHQLNKFHNDQYGTNFVLNDYSSYDLGALWNCSKEEKYARVGNFFDSDYYRQIRPVQGSVKGVEQLRQNHEGLIITARPLYARDSTIAFAENHHKLQEVYFTGEWHEGEPDFSDKPLACLALGVNVIVEDNLENALGCASVGVNVALLNCPWNQQNGLPDRITRVNNWLGIVQYISSLANKKK
jgi:uncharacterized HAD superfamily protein